MPLAGCLIDKTVELFLTGFVDWAFMSVHSWGENPLGNWTLEVHNDASAHRGNEGKFYTWTLQLFGTESDPNSDIAESGASTNPLENSIPVVRQALKVIDNMLGTLSYLPRVCNTDACPVDSNCQGHRLGHSNFFLRFGPSPDSF